MKAAAFEYERPRSCAEAARLLHQSAGRGKVISGGQSLGAMMNLRLAQPELLVDVRAIDALQRCEIEADWVWLGANTTHAAIEDGRVTDPTGGLMRQVAAGIAYRAVRNRGTLGGSLARTRFSRPCAFPDSRRRRAGATTRSAAKPVSSRKRWQESSMILRADCDAL